MAINIEAILKEAEKRGVFDNLPGKGKPLPEDKFKDLPEEIRMTYRILKNAGFAPSEFNLKKSLDEMKNKLKTVEDPNEKKKLMIEMRKIEAVLQIKLDKITQSL